MHKSNLGCFHQTRQKDVDSLNFDLTTNTPERQTTQNQIFENNLSRIKIILQFLLLFRHQFYMENYYVWNLSF